MAFTWKKYVKIPSILICLAIKRLYACATHQALAIKKANVKFSCRPDIRKLWAESILNDKIKWHLLFIMNFTYFTPRVV